MTSPQTTPKAEPFVLENVDMTLIPAANRADGVPNTWSAIWKFQVPAGQMMVIGPDDTLSMYLEDTVLAEVGNNTARVRISVSDTSGQDFRVVYGPVQYVTVKEFQDRRRLASLRLPQPIQVFEEQFLIISASYDAVIRESISAFALSMTRVRQGLS